MYGTESGATRRPRVPFPKSTNKDQQSLEVFKRNGGQSLKSTTKRQGDVVARKSAELISTLQKEEEWPPAASYNAPRCTKQVRFHGNMDGSSLAHAIHVPMGPLLKKSKTPKARTIQKDPCDSKGYTHTTQHTIPETTTPTSPQAAWRFGDPDEVVIHQPPPMRRCAYPSGVSVVGIGFSVRHARPIQSRSMFAFLGFKQVTDLTFSSYLIVLPFLVGVLAMAASIVQVFSRGKL